MNIYVFDLKIVLCALEKLCGALLGYFELHFGSQEAPWELWGGLPAAPWRLIITRQTPWIVTLEFLRTSLRLSWSPLGAPETSIASKSDAQSSFGQIFVRF